MRLPIAAFLLGAGLLPGIAAAAQPNGPWITEQQNVSLEGFMSNEQLYDRLAGLARRSAGALSLEQTGSSGQGQPIWLARLGSPDKPAVMVMTQQHGNEPHGTEAALDLIGSLASGGALAREVLDSLQVLIIPRVNPDGTALFTRGNTDFSAPQTSASCLDEDGNPDPAKLDQSLGGNVTAYTDADGLREWSYDINRYHWPDWSQSTQVQCNPGLADQRHFNPGQNPVPEAVAVRSAYDRYQPIWLVDVHNQNPAVVLDEADPEANRPGRQVTGSITWPTHPEVAQAAVELSKQMAVVMKKRSLQIGHMEITNYYYERPDGSIRRGGGEPGIARNAYALLGSQRLASGASGPLGGSVLMEITGLNSRGQKSIGMLRNNVREMLEALLLASADGSLLSVDPAEADQLLRPGQEVDQPLANPHE
ncbi:Zinc carboxypeptidase [Pseudomonas benzenivorans]|nr:M14 family zinc carboxypeptidase [Pseudomonas benzenivorans]SDH24291.1 Zinc carboxypeptidase [Pseudomonas benzenivorans]